MCGDAGVPHPAGAVSAESYARERNMRVTLTGDDRGDDVDARIGT